jgi:hypothetical protein
VADTDSGGVRVGIAPSAGPLDPTPDFTYLTRLDGLAVQHISTKRGRADERSKIDAGTCTVTGLDLDGILDPTNPGSPFYGQLNPLTPFTVELENPVSGDWLSIFRGYLNDLTLDLDVSEQFLNFTLEAGDAIDLFSDVEVVPDKAGNTVPAESRGDVYYDAVHVDDRILAAIADATTSVFGIVWPAELLTIFSGNVYVQGTVYSARTSLLEVIQNAADAEFPGVAVFFADKKGALVFHGRYARFNPEAYIANGIVFWNVGDEDAFATDETVAVAAGLTFTRGKTNLINAALSYPEKIADTAIGGQLAHDDTSINAYGPRSISFENLITQQGQESGGPLSAQNETKAYAQFWVDNMAAPKNRISKLTFTTQDPDDDRGPAFWSLLCGVDLSHVLNVKTTHPGGGGFDEQSFVESLAYTIDLGHDRFSQIKLEMDVSPRSYYALDPFTP